MSLLIRIEILLYLHSSEFKEIAGSEPVFIQQNWYGIVMDQYIFLIWLFFFFRKKRAGKMDMFKPEALPPRIPVILQVQIRIFNQFCLVEYDVVMTFSNGYKIFYGLCICKSTLLLKGRKIVLNTLRNMNLNISCIR